VLLLVTILLVVVGAISLGIGYVQSSLPPIYLSIACSVVAFGVLLIFARMSASSRKSETSTGGPAPLDFDRPQPADRTQPAPALAGAGPLGRSSTGGAFAPESGDDGEPPSRDAAEFHEDEVPEDEVPEDDFPIERYDSRRVGEILPLLAELDVDELDLVREHEERGKGRATVLARIDQLIDQLEAEDRHEAEHRFDSDPDIHADVQADADVERDMVPAPPLAAPQTVSVAALPDADDDDYFPIEDYDDLRASEILPLLPELEDDELEMVRSREQADMGRSSILHRIEALLEASSAAPPAGPAPVPAPEEVAVFEPEPEPEPVVTIAPPSAPAKRARVSKAPAGRSSKVPAATAGSATMVPDMAPPAKAPARTAKNASKPPAAKVTPPAKVAKVATAPVKAAKATVKAAKVSKAPVSKAPAAKSPASKAPAPRRRAEIEKASAKPVPAKRTQKGAAGATTTPASKATKKASKR